MKKIELFLVSLLAVFLFSACGGNDDIDPGNTDNHTEPPAESDSVLMNIFTLVGADEAAHPVPRLIAEWGENMVAQVTNPANDSIMMFQYVNSHEQYDAAVLVSKHNVVFMHYNPLTDRSFPTDVLMIGDYDNFSSVSSCKVDWSTNDIEFVQTIPLSTETSAKKYLPEQTRGENDNLKKPFFDMLDQISGDIGKIKDVIDDFGAAGRSASILCDAWTGVLIPIMKYQLYNDDEIAQRHFVEELFTSQVMSVVEEAVGKQTEQLKDESVKFLCKITSVDEEDVNMALWAYDLLERVTDKTGEERNIDINTYEDRGVQASVAYASQCAQAAPIVNVTYEREQNAPVAVTLTVDHVTNSTISVSGRVRIDDSMYANVLSAGYVYYVGNREYRLATGVDANFNIQPATIQNLQPNTSYRIAAYYETLASNSIFYSEFTTVETTGEKEDNQWEGTKWHFSGKMISHDSIEGDEEQAADFILDLTDLGNWALNIQMEGERSYSIDSEGNLILKITHSYYEKDSDGYVFGNYEQIMTLHRTSATTATLKWDGVEEGGWHSDVLNRTETSTITLDGSFEGTLVE
ncbi:MAG: hypothetical protein K6F94_03185 [Bacteroidaceae bacterium]|nr:hypothetical protein [Bacteroidaceae bacterium]